MSMTIVTYGGGEILNNIFNSLAIFLNSDKGILSPLMIISISCGALWALGKAYFSSQADSLILRYILPLIAITSILMIPNSSVKIEDIITKRSYTINHVPFCLARTAEFISSIGYIITNAIESVMHVPSDLRKNATIDAGYNNTGMIFGSESSLDMSKYKLTNAVLEQNLKRFSKQCIFYDIALNRYTLNDLKKSSDLWKFLSENSSKVRMIPCTDPSDKAKETKYLTCLDAVKEMTEIFGKEKKYYASQDIFKDLPLTFQVLTGLKKTKEELISQQLMINLISGEFNGDKLAKDRAHTQQKSTYVILGSLASSSLITMRAVFEALIYASVIIVIPLSVLPGGISFLANWLWMLIWLQMWAPFYAILNYIMQTAARMKVAAIFSGLSDAENGLSFFTSSGLIDIHDNIFALSGYLSASIPFISYAIVKGGVSSFIHLAGSMMTPAHAAATSASAEQTSGNYSFANTNFGQSSYGNASAFQKNYAPTLSNGYMTENTGDLSTTYAANGEQIFKQNSSAMRTSLNYDNTVTNGFQEARQQAEMVTVSQQKSYTESLASHGREMADLSSHIANSNNHSIGLSEREAFDIQESARYFESVSHGMGKSLGISDKECASVLFSVNGISEVLRTIPYVGNVIANILPNASFVRDGSIDNVASQAINLVNGTEFQTNMQKVLDYARSDTATLTDDNGIRYVEGVTRSLDQVESSQELYQAAKARSDQISQTESFAEQNSLSFKKTLDQDYVNWATEKYGAVEAKHRLFEGTAEETNSMKTEFSSFYREQMIEKFANSSFSSLDDAYSSANVRILDEQTELKNLHEKMDQEVFSSGLQAPSFDEQWNRLDGKVSSAGVVVEETRAGVQNTI